MAKLIAIAPIVVGTLLIAACWREPSEPTVSEGGFSIIGVEGEFVVNNSMPQGRQPRGITSLYRQYCANCHGDRGQGGPAGTQTLLTEELFDQKYDKPFFEAIRNGVPDMGMEAFGESLSDIEIWGLVVHIRELQGRALRSQTGSPRPVNGVYTMRDHKYRVETVVAEGLGLRIPWAVDWLPDGRMLVTNRPGQLHVFHNGRLTEVQDVPPSRHLGQGGLMAVAVHPQYAQNGWVYLGLNDPARDNPRAGNTKIVRGKLRFDGNEVRWTDTETIFETTQDNYSTSGVHFGVQIVFDGRGHIFFPIGDRGAQNRAQDLTRPNGKVFRVREDGTVPDDNPFAGEEYRARGYLPEIWSYGHRNPQALVFDLEGRLWSTEHGPRGGDELNEVVRGENYGWPVVSFSINYNDIPFTTPWPEPGQSFRMPVFRWIPSIGACGMDVVRGNAFPRWRGDLLAGGLVGENVDRFRLKDGQLVEREEIVHGLGRVRGVSVGPEGYIYLVLNQPDKVVRLVPAD